VDRQVREAQDRGEFDGLSGHGAPLADIDKPYDEQWWVKRKLRDEGVSYLPPSLALRKEAEVALEAAVRAPTEDRARRIVDELNVKIRAAIRIPPAGPPLNLFPYDVERVAADWRAARVDRSDAEEAGDPSTGGDAGRERIAGEGSAEEQRDRRRLGRLVEARRLRAARRRPHA
jgi:hypothetical protein